MKKMAKPDKAVTEETDIFQLMEEVERRKKDAIGELLKQREELTSKLNRLGHYDPATSEKRPATASKGTKTGITRQRDPNAPCSVCQFATVPNHDGRVHRKQGQNKKPFTDQELAELGLTKK